MMMNTHKLIANVLFHNIDDDKKFLVSKNRFIWGTIKPDCASKYKFKKHYFDESVGMIIEMIKDLSKMTPDEVIQDGVGKFSAELGVVCHFLCDYYCIPHSQRWEFKNPNAVRQHVNYERELAKIAKNYDVSLMRLDRLQINDIDEFIFKTQEMYKKKESFLNDLNFAYYICNSVTNAVLKSVLNNTQNGQNLNRQLNVN
ncbi:zinc dependent phospholipase C family protein [uncultured Clostridium sp.]|uniref:zinc dependent phospholipase C family protein n=1 Tax=uncultured Clostridium sp. TaxID=59620 RepID=UPI002633BD5A|nr:zinc dependent phospholipase C family protein [uncultured Clostridium sp.]